MQQHAAHPSLPAQVIASTEDIPERAYNRWQAAFINAGSAADRVDAIEAPL